MPSDLVDLVYLDLAGGFSGSLVLHNPAFTIGADGRQMGFRLAPAMAAAAVLIAGWTAAPAYSGSGAFWGTAVDPSPGQSQLQALTALEHKVGRHFHVFRFYRPLNDPNLHSDVARVMKARGQPAYLNVNSQVGNRCVAWRAVAAGRYNVYLHRIAHQVKKYRRRVYFSWNHEMQNNCHTGTPREYRASYRRLRRVFRHEHVTNAKWVWVAAAGNFNHDPAKLAKYMPRHYDMVGVDGYSRAGEWRSVTAIFGAAHRFALKRGKRLFIGEVGCAEDPNSPSAKADWIAAAADTFRRWNVRTVVWTNLVGDGGNYSADTSAAALAAFTHAGQMTYYRR